MKKNIMIVDDDMLNIKLIEKMLQKHDINIIYAENGKDALSLINQDNAIDIIFMDIMMPEMDGFSTIRIIRDSEKYEHIPIVALTALAGTDDRIKCLNEGFDDFITKPFQINEILTIINNWANIK